MAISVVAVGDTGTAAQFDSVANWINARIPVFNQSTAATTTTATELKDGGVGDLTLTVADATAWYRVKYIARCQTDTSGGTNMDLRIRDGGASSPTTASTLIAAQSIYLSVAAGPGSSGLTADGLVQFTVGTHVLAGFYAKLAGAGNISVSQATGMSRVLSAELIA